MLTWKTKPCDLDYAHYLPLFFDGWVVLYWLIKYLHKQIQIPLLYYLNKLEALLSDQIYIMENDSKRIWLLLMFIASYAYPKYDLNYW